MRHGTDREPPGWFAPRTALALALIAAAGSARSDPSGHHYTQADRYAGCLVGYLIPALRRGVSHDGAMASAEDRCFPLSAGLSGRDLRDVIDEVNFFVAAHEERNALPSPP